MDWKVFSASAIGKYHIDNNIPCQDDSAFNIIGEVFIGVVCDGAGSAAHSEVGAKECSRYLIDRLSRYVESEGISPELFISDRKYFETTIDEVRIKLQSIADELGFEFHDLSCTVVGCITTKINGCFFHMGDGFGVSEFEGVETQLSLPENGEYANETYFVTASDWNTHLKITPFQVGQNGLVALMSDGAAPFVINRSHDGLSKPFVEPVVKYLSSIEQDEGNEALLATLLDERTNAITGDDKTLMIALLR